MWGRIADWFGMASAPFDAGVQPLETQMAGDAEIWRRIAARENLAEPDLSCLALPWHSDGDLGRPVSCVTDMSKSRRLGFTAYPATDHAFFGRFAKLRPDRLIPLPAP